MAKRKRGTGSAQELPSIEEMKAFIRTEGVRYLGARNVNSVGIGRKIARAGRPRAGVICIQFTVDEKAAPEKLESLGSRLIPPTFDIGGRVVHSDVIERRFRLAWQLVSEAESRKPKRKARQETLVPGLSIAHRSGTAGTIGAIVFDRETGDPMLLSNWHVLQMRDDGAAGEIGDEVVQPGPFDDNDVDRNIVGRLVRSHLGPAGDCALCTIEGRGYLSEIMGLKTSPMRLGKAELDDRVVKSGRTTGVTYGIVTRIEVQTKMTYGSREVIVGGFEIGPDERRPAKNGEISMGGDSGSAWMGADVRSGRATDAFLGLHFAGEASDHQPEFALACAAHSVLEKLGATLEPQRGEHAATKRAAVESERVVGGDGYDSRFVGVELPLPVPANSAVQSDLIGANGDRIAHYTHFSLSLRKSRRLAAFVAWNIDGRITKPTSKDAQWVTDQRIPREFQVDNTLYKGTVFDRGHVAKREDLLWGGKAVAKRANDDSFCYTNCTPQHERFNRLAPALWKSLEDELFRQVDVSDMRIALVGGPIFSNDDRAFKPSGAPAAFKGVRIPREYYKIVAYRDAGDNAIKVLAFRLSQRKLIQGTLEAMAPEALNLERFEMYQVAVREIEGVTGLSMPAFRRYDTHVGTERIGIEAFAEGAAPRPPRLIRSFADITR